MVVGEGREYAYSICFDDGEETGPPPVLAGGERSIDESVNVCGAGPFDSNQHKTTTCRQARTECEFTNVRISGDGYSFFGLSDGQHLWVRSFWHRLFAPGDIVCVLAKRPHDWSGNILVCKKAHRFPLSA